MFDSKTLNAYGSLLNKNDEKQKGNVSNGILGAMQSEKAMAAIQFANQQVAEIRSLATSGPLTFQVLSLIGGLAMTVQSVFGSFGKFLSFSPMQALIEVYCGFFGIAIVVLEGRRYACTHRFQKVLTDNCKILSFTWGRGLFYIFAGSLMFSLSNMVDMLIGGYVMFMGFTSVVVGRHTASKLTDLKHSMGSAKAVKAKFNEMDVDNNGSLDSKELANLCASLGSPLDHNELCAALDLMDRDKNGNVSFEEFFEWFSGWNFEKGDAGFDDTYNQAQFAI